MTSARSGQERAPFLGECMSGTRTQVVCIGYLRFGGRKPFAPRRRAVAAIFFAVSLFVSIVSPLSAASAQEAATGNVITETIHYDSGGFNIDAFLAKPSGAGKHPAVLVIHDNLGLNDSIRDIAKQFA